MSTRICGICCSVEFSAIDGQFFCDGCGTQDVRAVEAVAETENYNYQLNITKSVSQKGKKSTVPKEKPIKEKEIQVEVGYSAPSSFGTAGRRIDLSVSLIVRITRLLASNFCVDDSITDVCLSFLQEYLSKFGISLSPTEVIENENQRYIQLQKKKRSEIAAEKRRIIQLEKERLVKIKENRKEKMKRWQKALETDDDKELRVTTTNVAVDVFRRLETNLSIDTVNAAVRIDLRMSMLLCIVYLGCIAVGSKWILFSDLLRWHREDRFGITANEIITLGMDCDADPQKPIKRIQKRNQNLRFLSGVESLAYSHRSLSMLLQILRYSDSIVLTPFNLTFNRLLFDLNLPKNIWERARCLLKFLPAVTTDICRSMLHNTFPVTENGELKKKINKQKRIGGRTFNLYIDEENDQPDFNRTSENLVWIPIETKAAAVLLFLLKAIFPMERKVDEFSDADTFDFAEWLLQLSMRNFMRLGYSASSVLSSTFVQKSLLDERNIHKRAHRIGAKFSMHDQPLLLAPPRSFVPQKSKSLHSVFSADRNPFIGHSDLALYAPTRYQLESLSETTFDPATVDSYRLRIFQKEFNLSEIDAEWSKKAELKKIFPNLRNLKCIPKNDWELFIKRSEFVIANSALSVFFNQNRKFFDPIFDQLLYELALSIGEGADVLYFTFIVVEHCILMGKTDRRTEEENSQSEAETESRASSEEGNSSVSDSDDDRLTERHFFKYVIQNFW